MTSSITRSFDTPSSYTYDADLVEITGGKAQLKLTDNTGQTFTEAFTSDTGFTYDSDKSEFTGGLVRQTDQRPANAVMYGGFGSSLNLDWGDGTLTASAFNNAVASGGYLRVNFNDVSYVDFNGDNVSTTPQIGTRVMGFNSEYSGNPSTNQYVFVECKAAGDDTNKIEIMHLTSGQLRISMRNSSNVQLFASNLGVFNPVAGTDYQIRWTFDLTAGSNKMYLDGGTYSGQFGVTNSTTGTRDTNIGLIRIGSDSGGYSSSNFSSCALLVFDVVNTTTTLCDVSANIYEGDTITLPAFSYSDLGSIQLFTAFSTTDTNSPRYIINDEYWTGITWAASDGTWAQSSSESDISTNIVTLTVADTVVIKARTNDGSSQMSIDNLILTYTGQIYSTANPSVVYIDTTNMSDLLTFSSNDNASGSDAVKFAVVDGGTDKYWNGSAWATSSGYAQSNTDTELNTNVSSLLGDVRSQVKIRVYLHSDDGSTRPDIEDFTFTYDASLPDPTNLPRLVDVNGFIYDMNGPCSGLEVKARPYTNGYQNPNDGSGGGVFQKYEYEVIATTDSDGFFSGNIYLQPTGEYIEFRIGRQSYYTQLPNQDAVDFNALTLTTVS